MDSQSLLSLHRYWLWSNILRDEFFSHMEPLPLTNTASLMIWFAGKPGMYMAHWYTALYVVIEAYQKSDLRDDVIDELLESPLVQKLRWFRNGTSHFQPDYFDTKFAELMIEKDSAKWIQNVASEFGRFFLEKLGVNRG
jgi:hypothetical protein